MILRFEIPIFAAFRKSQTYIPIKYRHLRFENMFYLTPCYKLKLKNQFQKKWANQNSRKITQPPSFSHEVIKPKSTILFENFPVINLNNKLTSRGLLTLLPSLKKLQQLAESAHGMQLFFIGGVAVVSFVASFDWFQHERHEKLEHILTTTLLIDLQHYQRSHPLSLYSLHVFYY